MAKINLFFEDLSEEKRHEILMQLLTELKKEIDEAVKGKKTKALLKRNLLMIISIPITLRTNLGFSP